MDGSCCRRILLWTDPAVDGSRREGGGRGTDGRPPRPFPPWCNMALVLYEMNRSAEAQDCLSVAEELGGDDRALWNSMGVIMAGMGRHQEASESFSKAIRADWYYPLAWNNRGVSLARLGEVEEALTSFRRAVVLRENFPEAWYNLGLVFGELGDPKLSREAFKNAEDLGYKPAGGGYVLAKEEGFMGKTSILMLAAESRGIPGFGGVLGLFCVLAAIWRRGRGRDGGGVGLL
ncbi:tetratricopeptide repeat protein [Candidatus Methanocrinis natronophilus]|uniref:Tetratricopeptide repeat protein n=1 Tax=Candidatus Methanocrinis natronophilus TaxID=3033396 RepID=A0ABT5XBB9_9EURY|nr:tetratricopeptide repeat protein [Candidatus Methanocrinis natronophilus]MDF0591947.1 tetratricopeptide repeat protein [Candidatus Methanocrinis natronophilus]